MTATILTPKLDKLSLRVDGDHVLIIKDGALLLQLPWDAAHAVADSLKALAGRAEETAKAESIIYDQAILIRAGMPFGLTSNPVMIDEAGKAAAWDSNLRRYMPGGIQSQAVFGTPAVFHTPNKELDHG